MSAIVTPTDRRLGVYTFGMTAAQRVLLAVAAVGVTISALFLAERVGGPLIRMILGPPAGFNSDFTSRAAYGQALLVQSVTVGAAFFLLGVVGRRFSSFSYKHAVWVANPVTVGLGFAAYKIAYHSLHSLDYLAEYDSPQIFLLFCIVSPVVFAPCFLAGVKVRGAH